MKISQNSATASGSEALRNLDTSLTRYCLACVICTDKAPTQKQLENIRIVLKVTNLSADRAKNEVFNWESKENDVWAVRRTPIWCFLCSICSEHNHTDSEHSQPLVLYSISRDCTLIQRATIGLALFMAYAKVPFICPLGHMFQGEPTTRQQSLKQASSGGL